MVVSTAEAQLSQENQQVTIMKVPEASADAFQLRCSDGRGWWTGMSEKELLEATEKLAKALPRGVCN